MADENHPCALSHRRHHPRQYFVAPIRQRDFDAPVGGSLARSHTRAAGGVAGAVFEIGSQHLVASAQIERLHHRVDAGGGIGHEDQIVRPRPKKRPQASRAPSRNRPAERRPRNSTDSSSSSCQRCCASNTCAGQAPKLPWFRKTVSGSRRKVRACGALDGVDGCGTQTAGISVSAQS